MISSVRFGCGGMTPRFSANQPTPAKASTPAPQQPAPQPKTSTSASIPALPSWLTKGGKKGVLRA